MGWRGRATSRWSPARTFGCTPCWQRSRAAARSRANRSTTAPFPRSRSTVAGSRPFLRNGSGGWAGCGCSGSASSTAFRSGNWKRAPMSSASPTSPSSVPSGVAPGRSTARSMPTSTGGSRTTVPRSTGTSAPFATRSGSRPRSTRTPWSRNSASSPPPPSTPPGSRPGCRARWLPRRRSSVCPVSTGKGRGGTLQPWPGCSSSTTTASPSARSPCCGTFSRRAASHGRS